MSRTHVGRPDRAVARCAAALALLPSATLTRAQTASPPAPAAAPAASSVMVMRAERVGEGVHVVSGFANGNLLVASLGGATLLVDGQSSKRVGLADSVLRTLGAAPVRFVVTTHYHDDHVGGNPHWRARGAIVVGHRRVRPLAARDTVIAGWNNWHHLPEQPAALPDVELTDSLRLVLGGDTVDVRHLPAAHTGGDVLVRLRRANVIHLGDVLELGAPPFIDWWSGGTLAGMLAAVDLALGLADDRTVVVPGHGPVTDRAGLAAYRRMLATVGERVRAAHERGESLEATVAARPARDFEPMLGGERGARRFVAVLWAGLPRR